jgi:hypothetical protein
MGNVMRVLGIVLASMLLGLVGLFLLLFTICGGLKSSEGGGVLAVCLLLMVGSIGLIVFLGRGIASARTASRVLAVPPAAGTSPPPAAASDGPSVAATHPVIAVRPLAGTDLQVLVGLRLCLAIYILLAIGSIAFNFANVSRFGSGVAMQLILRNVLGLLPPMALLLAVCVRNPPAGAALDAVAGFGVASIVFRFGYLGFAGVFTSLFSQPDVLTTMLPRLAGYSALEAGLAGLAIYLRSRIGPLNPAALVVATLAFLFYEGMVQAVMQALLSVMI